MNALSAPVPAQQSDPSADLVADLRRWCGWSEFARSLCSQFDRKGYLSTAQAEAGARMVEKAKARADAEANRAEGRAASPAGPTTLACIMRMFATARASGLKRAKVRFCDADGNPIVLTAAGASSRYQGAVYVTDGGAYGSNKYFGRIDPTGVFQPGRDLSDPILNALKFMEQNPAEAATAYGQRTGCCCFCGRELTAEDSVSVGYGPICAANHGLPHGSND